MLHKWRKGYVAPPHKHLSAAHAFVLSGKLQVRDGTLEAGDYLYEPNGMVHGETKALEDTEYLFICDGPVLFFGENEFSGYLGWEQLQRLRDERAAKAASRTPGEHPKSPLSGGLLSSPSLTRAGVGVGCSSVNSGEDGDMARFPKLNLLTAHRDRVRSHGQRIR